MDPVDAAAELRILCLNVTCIQCSGCLGFVVFEIAAELSVKRSACLTLEPNAGREIHRVQSLLCLPKCDLRAQVFELEFLTCGSWLFPSKVAAL